MAAVKLSWLDPEAFSAKALRRTKRVLGLYQRRLAPFRVLSSVYFITLFVLGPSATYYAGLGYALSLVIPVHLIGLATLVTLLIVERRAWRMEWQQLLGLAFECAVCPGYFVNICRKLSLGYVRVPGDAVAFVLDQREPRVSAVIAGGIDALLEDLADRDELRQDDDQPIAAYQAWLAEAGAHA